MNTAGTIATGLFVNLFTAGIFTFLQCYVGSYLIAPLKPTRGVTWAFRSLVFINVIIPMFLIPYGMAAQAQGLWTRDAAAQAVLETLWSPLYFIFPSSPVLLFILSPLIWSGLIVYVFSGLRRIGKPFTEPSVPGDA